MFYFDGKILKLNLIGKQNKPNKNKNKISNYVIAIVNRKSNEKEVPKMSLEAFYFITKFPFCTSVAKHIIEMSIPGAIFFSVVNICIELSLYAVAVRFFDFRFFLL